MNQRKCDDTDGATVTLGEAVGWRTSLCKWICGKILPKDIDTPPALLATAVVVVVVKMEVDSGASMFEKSMSTFALHNER